MLELKDAFGVLGLGEDVSREELEKRYGLLIRQKRSEALADDGGAVSSPTIEEITEAYNFIINRDLEEKLKQEEQKHPRRQNAVYKILGVDQKKAENFFHYHKFHILFITLGILIAVFLVKSIVFRTNPDLNLAVIGRIDAAGFDTLKMQAEEKIPGVKKMEVDTALLTGDRISEQEDTVKLKAALLFQAADMDISIVDKSSFDKFGAVNSFVPLDELVQKLGVDKARYQNYIAKAKGQQAEHVYGINVTDSSLLKQAGVIGSDMIVTIRNGAKHYDKAVKLLELLLK